MSKIRNQIVERIASPNLFPESPTIKAQPIQTYCCGQQLLIQKTDTKNIITLDIGKIHVHMTFMYCPLCKEVYAPEDPSRLVPEYCNFGFDVIEYIGKAVFENHLTEIEVAKELLRRNVFISESEVTYLAKKFIHYLALAH